ncbi:hypothetical protein HPB49_021160 [Dermacentor silvarum]|uniref:Uncharacterized protein n=1 Tax=Dermacentor silvarum TaxID=543639 RepID=A0ACB8C5J2_DERSI|nr:hypothetical protein HPB49_021160 [Dermacentor silvarum]
MSGRLASIKRLAFLSPKSFRYLLIVPFSVDFGDVKVHKEWLSLLVKDKAVPRLFLHQDGLTDVECEILMHETPSTAARDFTFVTVIRIVKMDNRQAY